LKLSLGLAVEKLNNLFSYLNRRSPNSPQLRILREALLTLQNVREAKEVSLVRRLVEAIETSEKCVKNASLEELGKKCGKGFRDILRISTLIRLVEGGEIRNIVRARRSAYASIALSLPVSALFGLPPAASLLMMMGALFIYPYVVRLKKVGVLTVVSVQLLLLPYLVNAVWYFATALGNPSEIEAVSKALGVGYGTALALVLAFFVAALAASALIVYSVYTFAKYFKAFE